MKKLIIFTFFTLFISSCATSYQSVGFRGGYTETQLNEDVYKVTFRGNMYVSDERASDFITLRGAELALTHDFIYFTKVNETNTSSIIKFYKKKPKKILSYNAKFVYKNMKAKYNIK